MKPRTKKHRSPKKRTIRFRSAKRLPKRSEVMNRNTKKYKGGFLGGVAFPASFSQSVVDANPQSYLPVNTFSNDPNYSVVDARLTAPFLNGVSSGGRRRRQTKKGQMQKGQMQKGQMQKGGAPTLAQYVSNGLSSTVGQFPSAGIATNIGGVTNIAANLSGMNATFNSTPKFVAPIA